MSLDRARILKYYEELTQFKDEDKEWLDERIQSRKDVKNNVFGIDFSEKSVRVGRMLNIIAGDGHTNVIELNSLD